MRLPYRGRNAGAGVTHYEVEGKAIVLEFGDGKFRYVYDAAVPGAKHVAAMKRLAAEGKGLSTYVNQHVRGRYARKLPAERPR